MMAIIESYHQPKIFFKQPLKRMLDQILLEKDPSYGITQIAIQYYTQVFQRFILEKVAFEWWKIKNDHKTYDGWLEIMKSDQFMENVWNNTYEHELTFLYR